MKEKLVSIQVNCPDCKGTGVIHDEWYDNHHCHCEKCQGTGKIMKLETLQPKFKRTLL
jgi:DnaJ-class molecular chaperone